MITSIPVVAIDKVIIVATTMKSCRVPLRVADVVYFVSTIISHLIESFTLLSMVQGRGIYCQSYIQRIDKSSGAPHSDDAPRILNRARTCRCTLPPYRCYHPQFPVSFIYAVNGSM